MKSVWLTQAEMFMDKLMYQSSIKLIFIHVSRLSSLVDVTLKTVADDKMKCTVTLRSSKVSCCVVAFA